MRKFLLPEFVTDRANALNRLVHRTAGQGRRSSGGHGADALHASLRLLTKCLVGIRPLTASHMNSSCGEMCLLPPLEDNMGRRTRQETRPTTVFTDRAGHITIDSSRPKVLMAEILSQPVVT